MIYCDVIHCDVVSLHLRQVLNLLTKWGAVSMILNAPGLRRQPRSHLSVEALGASVAPVGMLGLDLWIWFAKGGPAWDSPYEIATYKQGGTDYEILDTGGYVYTFTWIGVILISVCVFNNR